MATHELRVRVIFSAPTEYDPELMRAEIAKVIPGANVILDHARYAAEVRELPNDVKEAIRTAEYGEIEASKRE